MSSVKQYNDVYEPKSHESPGYVDGVYPVSGCWCTQCTDRRTDVLRRARQYADFNPPTPEPNDSKPLEFDLKRLRELSRQLFGPRSGESYTFRRPSRPLPPFDSPLPSGYYYPDDSEEPGEPWLDAGSILTELQTAWLTAWDSEWWRQENMARWIEATALHVSAEGATGNALLVAKRALDIAETFVVIPASPGLADELATVRLQIRAALQRSGLIPTTPEPRPE